MKHGTRHPHKQNRPTKICRTCGRPFQWRRKWAACWTEVRYCSQRCRRRKPTPSATG